MLDDWYIIFRIYYAAPTACPLHATIWATSSWRTVSQFTYQINNNGIDNYSAIGHVFWCYVLSHRKTISMINNLCISIITKRYVLYNTDLKQLAWRYDGTVDATFQITICTYSIRRNVLSIQVWTIVRSTYWRYSCVQICNKNNRLNL